MSKGLRSASATPTPEWWLRLQTELFNRLQEANARWIEHQRRDLDNTLDAFRQLTACKDFGEAAAVQQEWVAQCMRDAIADWTDWMRPFAEHGGHAHAKHAKEPAASVREVPERAAA